METEAAKEKTLSLQEIELHDRQRINPVLTSTGIVSNFTCFEQLYAYLWKPANHLFLASCDGKQRILLYRNSNLKDIRILFSQDQDDSDFIQGIKGYFNPKYIAYNLISEKPSVSDPSKTAVRDELIIDVPTIANLDDSKLGKDYRYFKKNHPGIQYRQAKQDDKHGIYDFLNRWSQRESDKRGSRVSVDNVKRYVDLFFDSGDIEIGVVIDDGKVIGLTAFSPHPSDTSLAVSTFSMVDRGYKQLGVFTKVEQVRSMQQKSYTKAVIGGTESEDKTSFKMRFMKNGNKNTYYSLEVYRDPSLSVSPNYLRDFWA